MAANPRRIAARVGCWPSSDVVMVEQKRRRTLSRPAPARGELRRSVFVAEAQQREAADVRRAGEAAVVLVEDVLERELDGRPAQPGDLVAERQVEEGEAVDARLRVRRNVAQALGGLVDAGVHGVGGVVADPAL